MGNNSKWISRLLIFLILSGFCINPAWAAGERGGVVQVFLGASFFDEDEMTFEKESSSNSTSVVRTDLSTMPIVGAAAQTPFWGETVQAGFEGGLLFNWWADTQAAVINNNIYLSIDSNAVIVDLFYGGFISADLGKWSRVYLGAGPLLMYGYYKEKTDDNNQSISQYISTSNSDYDFTLGLYSRAGIDFKLFEDSMIGVCVRATSADLSFDAPVGKVDVSSVQTMLTFSVLF